MIQPNVVPLKSSLGRRVLLAISEETGISVVRLTGREQTREVARSRNAFCWVMREISGYSMTQIGRVIGDRECTTVRDGAQRAQALRETDPGFKHWTDVMAAEFAAGSGERAG